MSDRASPPHPRNRRRRAARANPPTHRVYLIPGFFGFSTLGDLAYFAHVRDEVTSLLADCGVRAVVEPIATRPTASFRRRATYLLDAITQTSGPGDPIHLVGHSSGGLDARLLATPGVVLREDLDVEPIASRVRTVVTVSTPHRGTPVATFFATMLGQRVLELLSLATIYVLRFGRLPLAVLLKLGAIFTRLDDSVGLQDNVVDQLFAQLLGDFTEDRRRTLERFFGDVSHDQALIPQLTPDGLDLFNTTARDRPGVRYGSVVAAARAPGLGSTIAAGLDPYAQATHALYQALYLVTSRMPRERLAPPNKQQTEMLVKAFGRVPDSTANDGVAPTLSQLWGEVIHVAQADHLDVIGFFDDRTHEPPHVDWVVTGSDFRRHHFEALWRDVVGFMVGDLRAGPTISTLKRDGARRST